MNLVALSASHRSTDLELVACLSHRAAGLDRALAARLGTGVIVLATCNRFEIYLETRGDRMAARSQALGVIAGECLMDEASVAAAFSTFEGQAAVEHLFSVASGLESMVIGEREVTRQVSRALEASRAVGTLSATLDRLFQDAIRVAREVDAETGLREHGRSVATVGLDVAADALPSRPAVPGRGFSGRSVLLIGTGNYAALTYAALRARGCTDIAVYSHTGRARHFARERQVEIVGRSELAATLRRVDVIVSCSGRSGRIVTPETLRGAQAQVLIDLSLERDIDPACAQNPRVRLIDLDTVRTHAPELGEAPVLSARLIIEAGIGRFRARLDERLLASTLADEVARAEQDIARERSALLDAFGEFLDPAEIEYLVRKVRLERKRDLHARITRLKAAAHT
ncbi:glutamyl-tRNA reductase [Rarobacter faecitabidus]|uniref:Glutamyl-tRNA reductase n=1 Tax=Rarobacter faecitabidus TaxID=13243 RepID=A0A542ZE44_RARFA|nr:glutamyl-tRNA reductase [Rarobacter faecitabidus]TQL58612.1 glutamyl-tRNA reductase [Rarobacter faecitabidus]